jgi:hypothetical protein
MDGTQTESRPNKGWAGVRGIDTSKWKREGPHHYHFPGGTTNLAACPLKPRERRGSVFIHGSRARTDRFPTIMGLRVPDYWTVVRVGALVEDSAVQQHVLPPCRRSGRWNSWPRPGIVNCGRRDDEMSKAGWRRRAT